MIVSSEVQRPDRRDTATDPVPYAYAPTSVSSFFQVLNEIGGRDSREPDVPAPNDRAEASAPKPAKNGEDAAGSTQEPDTDTSSTNATGKPGSESDAKNQEHSPDGADETGTDTRLVQDPADATAAEVAGDATETLVSASQLDATDGESGTDPQSAVLNTSETGTALSEAALIAAGLKPDQTETNGPASAKSNGATTTATAGAEADGEVSAANPLPKTLNAILAENALQKHTPQPATASEAGDLAIAAAKTADDAAPAEEPAPPPSPLPRAAAMEIGGVRAEAPTIPRIPLANLPGELVQQIHMMQQEGTRTMRIRLVPENLGEIRIEIQGAGDTMRVRMIAATPTARDALESQMGDLRQSLQKQGLSLNNFTVETGSEQRQTPFGHERHGNRPAGAMPSSTAPGAMDATKETPPNRPAEGAGALNVFA